MKAWLAQQQFHDIAPAVDYSLIPAWLVLAVSFIILALVGGAVWLIIRARRRRPVRIPTARQRALEQLDRAAREIDTMNPYQFSIFVSDILRRYVSEQYQLPLTRQTSVEFLSALSDSPAFSADDKALLDDFLSRCDLIKFARYDATRDDSRLLLEEATRFVKGGALEPA
ncbi:MAG: DUF4381 family protein [Chthoniobacterales bacterium]